MYLLSENYLPGSNTDSNFWLAALISQKIHKYSNIDEFFG